MAKTEMQNRVTTNVFLQLLTQVVNESFNSSNYSATVVLAFFDDYFGVTAVACELLLRKASYRFQKSNHTVVKAPDKSNLIKL
ncbi:hypothetical protein D770_21140 [Flammeovirgaceae bacterium 311]|nr:hypothetical protein D770_21140 [Flammeovirgaceae bacterium 311]